MKQVKYNPNNWYYRSVEAIKVNYVAINKDTYEVKTDCNTTINSTLSKLRIIGRDDLTPIQLDEEYKRIIKSKIESTMPENMSVVKVLEYKEIVDKYAFTLEELIALGHHMTETEDGYMIDIK